MSKHIDCEYLTDIDLEGLDVGDTVTATKGADRACKRDVESAVTYEIKNPSYTGKDDA